MVSVRRTTTTNFTEDVVENILHTRIPSDLVERQRHRSQIGAEFRKEIRGAEGSLFQTDAENGQKIVTMKSMKEGTSHLSPGSDRYASENWIGPLVCL